jgi:hypothetical protein
MRQEVIHRVINGTEPGFISQIEASLATKLRPWAVTESIIRSPRNYLAEGGILRVLLLESLSVKKQLGLFYILAYIYGVYSIKYPEGTPRMEDDDYVLYSKVEEELRLVVPEIMQMLKDTYEAWVVNEVMYGAVAFNDCTAQGRKTERYLLFYPFKTGLEGVPFLPEPRKDTSCVWKKRAASDGVQWETSEWRIVVEGVGGKRQLYVGAVGVRGKKVEVTADSDGWVRRIGRQTSEVYFDWENAPQKIYAVPAVAPTLSSLYAPHCVIGAYEQLYGPVTLETIFRFEPHIEQLAVFSEGLMTFIETTEKILKFYHSYLAHPSTDWRRNIATISILLNVAHNNGSMSEDLGSKYTTTKEHGVDEEYLDKLSNLHRHIPQGTDHKTLRGIYNECFYILAELR